MRNRAVLLGAVLSVVGALAGCWRPAALPATSTTRSPIGPGPAAMPRLTTEPLVGNLLIEDDQPENLQQEFNVWKPTGEPREWKYIVLHHTATDRGSVESIHESHLERKDKNGTNWLGIGYHFVIGNGNGMPDGEIEPTFRWREQMHGAHAGSNDYNQLGIGICLVGNFEEAQPTNAQIDAVERLVATLKQEYDITADRVVGHSEVKSTACPGRHFPLESVRQSSLVSQQLPARPREFDVAELEKRHQR